MRLVSVKINANYEGEVTSTISYVDVVKETEKVLSLDVTQDRSGFGFRRVIYKRDLGVVEGDVSRTSFTYWAYDEFKTHDQFHELTRKVMNAVHGELANREKLHYKWHQGFNDLCVRRL